MQEERTLTFAGYLNRCCPTQQPRWENNLNVPDIINTDDGVTTLRSIFQQKQPRI